METTENPEIDVQLGNESLRWASAVVVDEGPDPFAEPADELRKTLAGMDAGFKRKSSRTLSKARENVDGSAKTKQIEVETLTGYLLFDVILPPYNMEALASLYLESTPHRAAVGAKVSNIVGLGYQFVESPKLKIRLAETDDEEAKTKMVRRNQRAKMALEDLIDDMNKEDSLLATLKKVWTDYETTGNGYLEIGRKVNGDIGYIGHIPSTAIRVRKQRDGFVQITADKVVFFRNFGEKTRDPLGSDPRPNEIIHIKKYSPTNSFYGVPDIIAALQAVAGNDLAFKYNLDYFSNKAVPRHVIVSKGADLSRTAQLRLTEFFETSLKGKNHRTLYVPLPREERDQKVSFEIQPVEAGVQESSFGGYIKTNDAIIFMAHRTPITKVSAVDVPLAAARDLDKTFKEQVCRPEQTDFEYKINKVIKELTDMFLLKLNELSLTDEDTQSQIDERNVRNGIDLPNEIRGRRGMPPIKVGAMTPHEQEMSAQSQSEQHAEKLAKEAQKAQVAAAAARPAPTAPGTPAKTAPKTSTQRKADQKATAGKTRTRDAARSAGASDTKGEGRNAKGDGRKTG